MPLLHRSSTIGASRAKQLAVARRQWLRPILNLGHNYGVGLQLLGILFLCSINLYASKDAKSVSFWIMILLHRKFPHGWTEAIADFRSMSIFVLLTGTGQGDWMSETKLVMLEHVGTCLTVNLCHFCSLDNCVARGRSRWSRSCSPHQQGQGTLVTERPYRLVNGTVPIAALRQLCHGRYWVRKPHQQTHQVH